MFFAHLTLIHKLYSGTIANQIFCIMNLLEMRMNIFSTDPNPIYSARNLDDVRCNKMIIESAALLANAIAFYGGKDSDLPIAKTSGKPFKTKAWQNHPSCLWVKESRSNYEWLLNHMIALIDEMQFRKTTVHSMTSNIDIFKRGIGFIPAGELTPFANCTPYKNITDTVDAYRMTMVYKWEHDGVVPKWTKRDIPDWYNQSSIQVTKNTIGEFPWTGLRQSRSKRVTGWLTNEI